MSAPQATCHIQGTPSQDQYHQGWSAWQSEQRSWWTFVSALQSLPSKPIKNNYWPNRGKKHVPGRRSSLQPSSLLLRRRPWGWDSSPWVPPSFWFRHTCSSSDQTQWHSQESRHLHPSPGIRNVIENSWTVRLSWLTLRQIQWMLENVKEYLSLPGHSWRWFRQVRQSPWRDQTRDPSCRPHRCHWGCSQTRSRSHHRAQHQYPQAKTLQGQA